MVTHRVNVCGDEALARSLQVDAVIDCFRNKAEESKRLQPHGAGRCRKSIQQQSWRSNSERAPDPPVPFEARLPMRSGGSDAQRNDSDAKRSFDARLPMRSSESDTARNDSDAKRAERRRQSRPSCKRATKQMDHSLSAANNDGSRDAARNKTLLYVLCEINGRVAEMMVDTGAQTSIISKPLMQKMGLERLLNTRMRGTGK